ncbi:MAG: hypothetical protein JWO90_1824, partial [Solirubrobacterales bacterium]|nr:hypothetical protein [Solirubrobacterales bacterium]
GVAGAPAGVAGAPAGVAGAPAASSGSGAAAVTPLPLARRVTVSGARILTVGATLPKGARVARIAVFRVIRAARPSSRTAARTKLVGVAYRTAGKGRRQTFRLTEKRLRNLRPGQYVIEVRVGTSRSALGPATRRAATIKKAVR